MQKAIIKHKNSAKTRFFIEFSLKNLEVYYKIQIEVKPMKEFLNWYATMGESVQVIAANIAIYLIAFWAVFTAVRKWLIPAIKSLFTRRQ